MGIYSENLCQQPIQQQCSTQDLEDNNSGNVREKRNGLNKSLTARMLDKFREVTRQLSDNQPKICLQLHSSNFHNLWILQHCNTAVSIAIHHSTGPGRAISPRFVSKQASKVHESKLVTVWLG